ncbi:MAG TPA: metallopeptidase TldD-related protein [Blastocatellia bacterium]|nr:metallopeptidase TldD-related protein [Blastocatellia bacterium]
MDSTLAADVVARCMKRGATAAEVIIRDETEFSVGIRLGEIETLTEAESRALGLRALIDGRQASVSTSDFSSDALDALVDDAIALARATSVDESADLPAASDMATDLPDLELYDPALAELSADAKIDMAIRCERAALDVDERIVNSDRGGLSTTTGATRFANSLGFSGAYRTSSISLGAVPVARDGDEMQRDHWYDVRRALADLESPESIGRRAAERALGKLGARKVESCEAPIVFDPSVARDLLGTIFQAASGEAVFRKASMFADRLSERVAVKAVTIVDDGRIRCGSGSRPFDGEGLATRQTVVIREGVLENFLLNTYTGRKLGRPSTGNATRGIVGQPGVGPGNLYFEAGTTSRDEIVGSVKRGFLVTELMGFGVNIVNGDYSRGAAGVWIEDGELAYPVEEVTIAGNLKDMLLGIDAVGSDLEFRGRMGAPTLLIGKMTISGR